MKQVFEVRAGDRGSENMYYSGNDQEHRCVGHLRCDFGRDGDEFWTSFFPHECERGDDSPCKEEFTALVRELQKDLLKNRKSMSRYIQQHPSMPLESGAILTYGFQVRAEICDYYIRCTPHPGCYDAYIYAYLRERG